MLETHTVYFVEPMGRNNNRGSNMYLMLEVTVLIRLMILSILNDTI